MNKKYEITLSADHTTEKLFLGNYKMTLDESVSLIVWKNGTGILDGTVEIIGWVDESDEDGWDILDTITLNSSSGREARPFEYDLNAIQFKCSKNDMTGCDIKIFVKLSEKP